VAVVGVATCPRVIALFGADDWVSFAVMLVMCWIALGCLVDVGFTGASAGHLADLWYWQFAAFSAIWLVGSYWLVNRAATRCLTGSMARSASHRHGRPQTQRRMAHPCSC
jgi:hypothetical protein